MRLREIEKVINDNVKGLSAFSEKSDGKRAHSIKNFHEFLDCLDSLGKVPSLKEKIDELLKTSVGKYRSNDFIVSNDDYALFKNAITKLQIHIRILDSLLSDLVRPQDKRTISLKLYDFKNYKDFYNFNNKLYENILSPFDIIGEEIIIGDFEVGSRWINIAFSSFLGVSLVTSITREAFDILINDYHKYKVMTEVISLYKEQNIDVTDLKNKMNNDQSKIYKDKSKLAIESVLNDSSLTDKDKDKLKKLDKDNMDSFEESVAISIKETTKQIDKGLQIFQALDTPQENRYKLPNFINFFETNKEDGEEKNS